jgi:rubrerythrin
MRKFTDLNEREILALAISNEEDAAKTYGEFAAALRKDFPDSARMFTEMAEEETEHSQRLTAAFASRFGQRIPVIKARDVSGIAQERPDWLIKPTTADGMRRHARQMEENASRFYYQAAGRMSDPAIRKLLGELAVAESAHEQTAGEMDPDAPPSEGRVHETESARKRFVLQVIQPGLVGLMDGSVSTLAPVFAAAFATENSWSAFLVGLAASIGAGISMGFAEALADDGRLSGRGTPYLRGLVCGLMTVAGGIGHTLPFLIPAFWTAVIVSGVVVVVELLAIAVIQWRYMDTPPVSAAAKVMLGGALVLAAGVLIGNG